MLDREDLPLSPLIIAARMITQNLSQPPLLPLLQPLLTTAAATAAATEAAH